MGVKPQYNSMDNPGAQSFRGSGVPREEHLKVLVIVHPVPRQSKLGCTTGLHTQFQLIFVRDGARDIFGTYHLIGT